MTDRRRFLKQVLGASSMGFLAASSISCLRLTGSGKHGPVSRGPGILRYDRIKQTLIDEMQAIPVYDCHTHIRPEAWRLKWPVSVTTLYSTHPVLDAASSMGTTGTGKNQNDWGYQYYNNAGIPIEERWKNLSAHLGNARYGSFFRASEIALRDIYGYEEANDGNYIEISEKMQAANKPGFYHELLRERCNIQTCLVQCSGPQLEELAPRPLLTPVYSGPTATKHNFSGFVKKLEGLYDVSITDLDTYLEVLGRFLADRKKNDGIVGFKVYSWGEWQFLEPDMAGARKDFKQMLDAGTASHLVEATVKDHAFRLCAELDLNVSVHGGGNYMDFRLYEPRRMIDIITRHPETRFDIFHLGLPFPRQIIVLAKMYPNVTLNLVWAQALSESITRQSINEILDMVPVNKVIAFGSDVRENIEVVYGYLVMMREVLAEALSERIRHGRIDLQDAINIAKLWFDHNPRQIYRLT